jgi:chlorite dismutase
VPQALPLEHGHRRGRRPGAAPVHDGSGDEGRQQEEAEEAAHERASVSLHFPLCEAARAQEVASAPVEAVTPSQGWGVLHLYYSVDRERAAAEPGGAKHLVDAVDALRADGHQALVSVTLGHKADLGVMALGPDLARLQAFQQDVLAAPLTPTYSYVSLTELSEYTSIEDEERARAYNEARLHPQLPEKRVLCFYPMSKRRAPGQNWYELPFDERKELMAGHGRVGRTYAGRILQLITGSVGFDDWEWGVTLLADDPVVVKEIVYEMRFDPVSAKYAEFGPFFVGLVAPVEEALSRVGLTVE